MTKILAFIIELIGWFQIVLSPLIVGLVLGVIIYLSKPDTLGAILGISVATIGLIVGVIFATRVWIKKGTINFLSRISATPELDNIDKLNEDSEK